MKDAVSRTFKSKDPMYVFNTHTSSFAGSRFYTQPGNMLEWVKDLYPGEKGPAFKLSEDTGMVEILVHGRTPGPRAIHSCPCRCRSRPERDSGVAS
jgi:hypothetical protein